MRHGDASSLPGGRWASQLLLAIRRGDVAGAETALKGGDADVSFFAERRPALVLCVQNHDIEMVRLLLRMGAGVNRRDSDDASPLHAASQLGFAAIAALLLQNRADVAARDAGRSTPLHLAAANDKADVVQLLLDHKSQVNATDEMGRTPLHVAAGVTRPRAVACRVVAYLLAAGADARLVDRRGNTALHYAVAALGASAKDVAALSKAFPSAAVRANNSRKTPLHIIVVADRKDEIQVLNTVLRHLISKDAADVAPPALLSPRSERGHTPLHLAVLERKYDLARLLIASGAEVDTRDQLGRTPLDCACRDGASALAALLVASGASARSSHGCGGKAEGRRSEMTQLLLRAAREPLPLTSHCRRVAARTWGMALQARVQELPAPWRRYLSYRDL